MNSKIRLCRKRILAKVFEYLFKSFRKLSFKRLLYGLILLNCFFWPTSFVFLFKLAVLNFHWKCGFINETDLNVYFFENYSQENEEWELLDKNIFISRNLSFYFTDDGIINSVVLSRNKLQKNFGCLIHATSRKSKKSILIKPDLIELTSSQRDSVGSYELTIQLPDSTNHELKRKDLEIYFIYETIYLNLFTLRKERTRRSILFKKISNKNNELRTNSIALCGPMLYLDSNSYKTTKEWIEFNIKIGFSKIILYVVLIENADELLLKYRNVVEIRVLNFIPNVSYLENGLSCCYHDATTYIKKVKYIRLTDNLIADADTHFVYHRGIINGCYLSCFKEYDRVAVFDNDELIYPNSGKIKYIFQDDHNEVTKETTFENMIKGIECQKDIKKYINDLNLFYLNRSHVSDASLWMHYGHYLNSSFVQNIFFHFKLKLSKQRAFNTSFKIFIHDSRNISFSVLSESDFIYLKRLINFYDNTYLGGESLIKLENNDNKRIWMIQESEKRELGWGKVSNLTLF